VEEKHEKRAAKDAAARDRRSGLASPTPIDTIPVRVFSPGAHLVYPAGEDDVRELLGRLPRGVADGVAAVELRPGRQAQAEANRDGVYDTDPLTGRIGSRRFPGAWSGRVLGRYRHRTATVELYAYAVDAAHPLRPVWWPLLKLEALAVLAHEVAHHHDHACRTARGRWRADGRERVERNAEARQHEWTQSIVLPYLRERYADELKATEEWVALHGGAALPFEAFADDPRVTCRRGLVSGNRLFFTMEAALRGLMDDFVADRPSCERKVHFARELHYRGDYEPALSAIGSALRDHPGDPTALALMADIFNHQERWADALAVAGPLVEADPAFADGWEEVARACEGLGRWEDAAAAATRLLELCHPREHGRILATRAAARLGLRDFEGAREDVERMEAIPGPTTRRLAKKLRERIEVEAAS
jgi:hypothetical protein